MIFAIFNYVMEYQKREFQVLGHYMKGRFYYLKCIRLSSRRIETVDRKKKMNKNNNGIRFVS